ncbi:MAG: nucleotidyl transferase AbiEii/AbiGii toxin family protein [bacterium]|nr:nucleotidyl transferase AbiEii/AbiGii toxin family protein [bacterium]
MITLSQATEFGKRFQINVETIYREYLQLVILDRVYQNKEAVNFCFKGGTALRLLFNSSRFSEDLDFDTVLSKKGIISLMNETGKNLAGEFPQLQITKLYSGKNGMRFRVKLEVPELKFPIVVRMDFTHVTKINAETSSLRTELPIIILPLIYHFSQKNILREKFLALVERDKGRDLFDILFLLRSKIEFEPKTVTSAVINKIKNFSQAKLESDLGQFLPAGQKSLVIRLKDLLIEELNLRIHG